LGVIILDTVGSCFAMKDENDNAEVNQVCNIMRHVGHETGTLIVLIHHYGKDAGTGLRGASAWGAAADTLLSLIANISPTTGEVTDRRMALAKSRDYAQGPIAPYTLEVVKVGVDEDGDEETSCIIKIDTQPQLPPAKKDTTSPGHKFFMKVARHAYRVHPDFLILAGVKHHAVELKHVRERYLQEYVTDGKPKAAQKAWERGLRALPEGWKAVRDPRTGDEWMLIPLTPG
jgi:hypothetical protein